MTDPNPFVRPEAVRVLSSLLGINAAPTLLTLANDTNAMVREAAAFASPGWKRLHRIEQRKCHTFSFVRDQPMKLLQQQTEPCPDMAPRPSDDGGPLPMFMSLFGVFTNVGEMRRL